jgi:hypothetical protein
LDKEERMAGGVDVGIVGESIVEFVHRRKGKVIMQGFTETNNRYTKIVSVDILNHRVVEDTIYKEDGRKEVKDFKNPVKYWSTRLKMVVRKIK